MGLHTQWVLGLRQNLQHFVIGQEEEPGSGIHNEKIKICDITKELNQRKTAKSFCLPWEKEALLLQIGIQSFHDDVQEVVRILQFL